MRYVFLATLLVSSMVGIITWAARPDLFETQYKRVAAPIEDHFSQQRNAVWQSAKEQGWKKWMAQAHLPADCAHPATALHALECKNRLQLQENAFENDWAAKVADGWRPEGVN